MECYRRTICLSDNLVCSPLQTVPKRGSSKRRVVMDLILEKGRHCLVFKKDLRRAYRQFPIDPKDYKFLGFSYQGNFYLDTRCPYGLRTAAMICQRTTKAVVHIFTSRVSRLMFISMTFTVQNILLLLPWLFPDSVIYFFNSAWILPLKRIHHLQPP